jgi:4,5-DOPA dioxygenase extradiol
MYSPQRLISRIFVAVITISLLSLSIYLASPHNNPNLASFNHFIAAKDHAILPARRVHTSTNMTRTPVYFFSHGGPNIMYDVEHPVYPQIAKLGKEITQLVKPKAIVVFSAHWQADKPNTIEVNTAETEPLIYDFYGFPKHYYMEKFKHRGSPELASSVMKTLNDAGIKTEGVERGLDHGVWAVFKVAFNEETNPIGDIPIVQVSLFDDDKDAASHIRLGRAVEKLREEGICIVVSGMAVHNLRDMWMAQSRPGPMPYAVSFDGALKEAVESTPGKERDEMMVGLLKRPDARPAHPTFEHLLPIHVGVGAAGSDKGTQVWTFPEGSFSWAQYRFGEVEA